MAKREDNRFSEENKTKVTLIKHYMAEKGMDGSEFDKVYESAVNAAIEKAVESMYKKYVPAQVRQLFANSNLTVDSKTATKRTVHSSENNEVVNSNE
ncbi:MAG: hypothetical protein IJ571_00135 [Ruminococcus sp.]|nr:hypothetical protein [Ruminococcus sp.]